MSLRQNKFPVDKWYYSNVASRTDKRDAQDVVGTIQGIPNHILRRFPVAIENEDMPETLQEVSNLIVADGFKEWHYDNIKQNQRRVSLLAADWTKLQMLRHIIEHKECSVITTDNTYLTQPFNQFESFIASMPLDLKALFLGWRCWVESPPEGWLLQNDHRTYMALKRLEPVPQVRGILANFGLTGWSTYFTWQGAERYLELWKEQPSSDGAEVLFYAYDRSKELEGFYCCNPPLTISMLEIDKIRNFPNLGQGNALFTKDK